MFYSDCFYCVLGNQCTRGKPMQTAHRRCEATMPTTIKEKKVGDTRLVAWIILTVF